MLTIHRGKGATRATVAVRCLTSALALAGLMSTAQAQDTGDDTDKLINPNCEPAERIPPDEEVNSDFIVPTDAPLRAVSAPIDASRTAEKRSFEACAGDVDYDANNERIANGAEKILPLPEDFEVAAAPCAFPPALTVVGGLRDNYAAPTEPANVTAQIVIAAGNPPFTKWKPFDDGSVDRFFGHGMPLNYSGFYRYGTITIDLKPNGSGEWDNDTLALWTVNGQPGWGARIRDLGASADREQRVTLNLANLRTTNGSLLDQINTFHNLNVFMQDDTQVDDITVDLACSAQNVPPRVGVIMGPRGCGALTQHDVFLDNEDNRNANNRSGWIGATISNKNTQFRFCAVDGNLFVPAANAGAAFALVSLAPNCPSGFTRFDRFHDNEDNRPASWDTTPGGSPTTTMGAKLDTNMAFCVSTGRATRVPNSVFPDLGVTYGVFGGRTPALSTWAMERGWVHLDDEDKNNRNQPDNPPSWTTEFLGAGKNTDYWVARIR